MTCLAENVFVHTTLAPRTSDYAGTPANGLVVVAGDHAVLVDTGWADAHAEALVAWSASRGTPITAAVATHSHTDRTGGARSLIARGIPVYGTELTIRRARERGEPTPDRVLTETSLPELRWFFPGAGHAPDNIVVAVGPVLHGGCFIKESAAEDLGYTGDADPAAWVASLDAAAAWSPHPRVVVPGHGAWGGMELITHTRTLAEAVR